MNKRNLLYISVSILIIILFVLLQFFLRQDTTLDYTQTKWQEIKGFKSEGYGFKVTINYESKKEECSEKQYFFSAVDGDYGSYDIPIERNLIFDANISQDRLSYVLKYPLNFKEDLCEMWAKEITIDAYTHKDLERNSNFDHLLTEAEKERQTNKKKYNDLFVERVVEIIHSSNVNEETHEESYDYPLNIYCQKSVYFGEEVNYIEDEEIEKEVWRPTAYCRPTGFQGMNTVIFLDLLNEKYNPLTLNILFSVDVKCHRACTDIQMRKLGITEKMYEGNRYDPATTDTRNEQFTPSDTLFKAFKKEYNIGL